MTCSIKITMMPFLKINCITTLAGGALVGIRDKEMNVETEIKLSQSPSDLEEQREIPMNEFA